MRPESGEESLELSQVRAGVKTLFKFTKLNGHLLNRAHAKARPFSGVEIKNRTIDSAACMPRVPANGVTDNVTMNPCLWSAKRMSERASGKEGASESRVLI